MPGAAILAGGVDEVLPLTEIAPAVLEWSPAAP
jgi:chemotaxis response regulator CheB